MKSIYYSIKMINISFEQQLKIEDFTEDSHPTVREYLCIFCLGVLVEPVVDHCGHIFCRKCILTSLKYNPDCPQSHEIINESELNNMGFIEKILEKQKIYCKNKINNCEWTGKYQFFDNHLKIDCPKQIINCGNSGCVESFFREETDNHLKDCQYRSVKCEYCNSSIAFVSLNFHYDECPKYLVDCQLNCGIKIERENLVNHIKNQCENAEISCYYNKYGCEIVLIKRNIEEHLKSHSENHNLLILKFLGDFYKEYQEKMSFLENTFIDIKEKINSSKIQNKERKSNEEEDDSRIKNKRKRNLDTDIENDRSNETKDTNNTVKPNSIRETRNIINNCYINKIVNNSKEADEEKNDKEYEEVNLSSNQEDIIWNFNNQEISNGLMVEKNKVISNSTTKNIHLFSFINTQLKGDSIYKWRVNILKYSTWIAFGVCDKAKVIKNNFIFTSTQQTFNNGCFLLSSNFYSWNCNNLSENNKSIKSNSKLNTKDTVILEYNGKNNELNFSNGSFVMKLTKVKSNSVLVPCVIFLCNGDEINIDFLKKD